MSLRSYKIQYSHFDFPQGIPLLPRVNYQELLEHLHCPLIWFYEELLDAWLPSEVTLDLIKRIQNDEASNIQLNRHGLTIPIRPTIEQLRGRFDDNGFVVIPQLMNHRYCRTMLQAYYARNDHLHKRVKDMDGISRTSANDMPLMRLVHQSTEQLVKVITSEDIKTSYSFAACYDRKSSLPAHTDRPQCVYNVTLMLGSSPVDADLTKWPLFIEMKQGRGVANVELNVGDAVLYSGTRDKHWRDPMPNQISTVNGVFFHYVPADFRGRLG